MLGRKDVPHLTVLKLDLGARIRLTAEQFERLTAAFLSGLEQKFVLDAPR